MSVSSIIGGGIRFVRTQPRVIAIWGGLYFAVVGVCMAIFMPAAASMMEFQRQAAANAAMGIKTPPVFPAGMFAGIFLFELIFFLLMIVMFAAAVRAVVRPTGDRFAYIRVGMDELRLIGLGVIFVVAAIVAELLAILLLVLIGVILSFVVGKIAGTIVAVVLGLVLFGAAIYAQIRLSLAGAFTVMQRRIVIKDAWRATKGQFWTLLGVYFLIALTFFIATILIVAVTNPHLLSAYASLDPQAMNVAVQEQIARQTAGLSVGLIIQMVIGAVLGTVMMAVVFGAVAAAALELQEAAASAA
jgi:hypothetical protein